MVLLCLEMTLNQAPNLVIDGVYLEMTIHNIRPRLFVTSTASTINRLPSPYTIGLIPSMVHHQPYHPLPQSESALALLRGRPGPRAFLRF